MRKEISVINVINVTNVINDTNVTNVINDINVINVTNVIKKSPTLTDHHTCSTQHMQPHRYIQ